MRLPCNYGQLDSSHKSDTSTLMKANSSEGVDVGTTEFKRKRE